MARKDNILQLAVFLFILHVQEKQKTERHCRLPLWDYSIVLSHKADRKLNVVPSLIANRLRPLVQLNATFHRIFFVYTYTIYEHPICKTRCQTLISFILGNSIFCYFHISIFFSYFAKLIMNVNNVPYGLLTVSCYEAINCWY